jgi:hypothetical protein
MAWLSVMIMQAPSAALVVPSPGQEQQQVQERLPSTISKTDDNHHNN